MWTVKGVPLPGVSLNAIFSNVTELPVFRTTISAMLLPWNSISPILGSLVASTPQDGLDPPFIGAQPAGCASVLATKHARPMSQMNIESRCAAATLGGCSRLARSGPAAAGTWAIVSSASCCVVAGQEVDC